MWYKNVGSSLFRLVTMADRRIDGQTGRLWKYRVLLYMQSHGKKDRAKQKTLLTIIWQLNQ